jgi:hypothetical protein
VTCDAIGCIGRLADGRLASMALEVEAFAELRTCGRGGERPRGTIIELCGNAGRSRGLAHAWRHRIALERPTLRARRLHFHRATDVRGHV